MKKSNEKAPQEAATSERSANELDQLKDTIKVRENQVPKEILHELAAMHKRFRELYETYPAVVGVDGSGGVHLTSEGFTEHFEKYNIRDRCDGKYKEELYTTFDSVRFFCIQ